MSLLKNGVIALVVALVGWFFITVFGWQWFGIIIYALAFFGSIKAIKNEALEYGYGFWELFVKKFKLVFSKDILNGVHVIVIVILPIVLYFFFHAMYVDFVLDSISSIFQ